MNSESPISFSNTVVEQGIVIVDDTPENLRLLLTILKEHGYKVRPASNGSHALATIRKEPAALILLDIMMPEMDGYEVCEQLKADEQTKNIPIIFMSALNDLFDKVRAFDVGGVDYISKPFQVEEVLARVKTHLTIRVQQHELIRQNQELVKKNILISEQTKKLELLARRDSLTGLSNRRDFMERAEQELTRFHRSGKPFSLVMLDIDHFKMVNDTYGHECGDQVLMMLSQNLRQALRAQDIPARWGGEEYICLLPDTDVDGAECVAEKIRTTIETLSYHCTDGPASVTVTLGICMYDGSCSIEECIRRADAALYIGKKQGRNQVVVSDNRLERK